MQHIAGPVDLVASPPAAGQVVACRPVYGARKPIQVLLECAPEPSTVDLIMGRGPVDAARVLVSGWQLDTDGRHAGRRYRQFPVWHDLTRVEVAEP